MIEKKLKTETQVQIHASLIESFEPLRINANGYVLKFFMGCSEVDSKPFQIKEQSMSLDQTLKIINIVGQQLEIWLCDTNNNLIGIANISIKDQQGEHHMEAELKLNNILFARLECTLNVIKRQIEKIVYVEPDEELLKREEDPVEVQRRKEEEERKAAELAEQERLARQEKKYAITKTHRSKKDEPYF